MVLLVPVGTGPAQVELAAAGAEHVGHGVEQRAYLRVAVALALDGLGVEPERDVVYEHAPVDLGQVDGSLAAVDERVEGADDIVAVDAEVEREVVPGAGGYAGVRQPALGRDRRDDRLRSVAAGHRERVGAAIKCPADERLEVPRRSELDRLDPACARLVGKLEALRLAAARLGLKKSTGCSGADASGRSTCMPTTARDAASEISSPATTSSSSNDESSASSSTTAPASASAATARPATRAGPRRSAPYQAAAPATSTQASRPRPRGNSLTTTATASAIVATIATRAMTAVSRRFTGPHLFRPRRRRTRASVCGS